MGETTRKRKKGTAGRCGAKAWAGDAEISKWNPTKEMTNQQCKTLFTTVNYKRESQPTIHLLLMARLKYSNGSLYGLVLFSSSATIFCHHLWQPSESDSFSTRSFCVLLRSSFHPPPTLPFPLPQIQSLVIVPWKCYISRTTMISAINMTLQKCFNHIPCFSLFVFIRAFSIIFVFNTNSFLRQT